MMHYQETKYGFEWGSAKIQRHISDGPKGWVLKHRNIPAGKKSKSM